jgi:hypothetical protein
VNCRARRFELGSDSHQLSKGVGSHLLHDAASMGVVVAQTAYDDQGQFSVNGQRADANYFTVDGVSANFGVTGLDDPATIALAPRGTPLYNSTYGTLRHRMKADITTMPTFLCFSDLTG